MLKLGKNCVEVGKICVEVAEEDEPEMKAVETKTGGVSFN